MLKLLKQKLNDLKMRVRGYERNSPNGVRGRVYSPKGGPVNPNTARIIKAEPKPELTMTILRKDGTVEEYKNGRKEIKVTHPDGTVEVRYQGKPSKVKSLILTVKEKLLRLINK